MDYKICNSCGAKVPVNANFCSECKSTSFRAPDGSVPMVNPSQSNLVYSLFYWPYKGGYVLSKSKVAGIATFLILLLTAFATPFPGGVVIIAAILAAAVFLVGFLFHFLKGQPSPAQVEYNDYGFLTDMKHFLFYWQNKRTGEYVLSKTKLISWLIYALFFALCMSIESINMFATVMVAAIFTAPVFILGFIVHKLTNNYPTNAKVSTTPKPKKVPQKTKKVERKEPEVIEKKVETPKVSQFDAYKSRLDEMKSAYSKKDANARSLMEKKFAPPQITYNRFIAVIDKSTEIFNAAADDIENIISLATEDSPRIDAEIRSKFDILDSITNKMDDLTNELLISMDSAHDEDVSDLVGDMENLIGSIKDYE